MYVPKHQGILCCHIISVCSNAYCCIIIGTASHGRVYFLGRCILELDMIYVAFCICVWGRKRTASGSKRCMVQMCTCRGAPLHIIYDVSTLRRLALHPVVRNNYNLFRYILSIEFPAFSLVLICVRTVRRWSQHQRKK